MDYNLLRECTDKIKLSDEMKKEIAVACAEKTISTATENRKLYRLKKAALTLTVACVFILVTLPVMAVSSGGFMDLLYRYFPEIAQNFTPVQLSCEDNGIKMEVVSICIQDNKAQFFIAVTDLQGGRIDSTVDLFDSYDINTRYDTTAHCQKVSYDEKTCTATFMIEIVADNAKKLHKEYISFSVKQLLTGKNTFEDKIDINTANITHNPPTVLKEKRGWSSTDERLLKELKEQDKAEMLMTQAETIWPVDGVTITAAGYREDVGCTDENLHIQVLYDNIRQTDNHGYVYLKHPQTGNIIMPQASISAFAEDGVSSYEEYIFSDIQPQHIPEYEVYGWFITCDTLITGNWTANFRVEEY